MFQFGPFASLNLCIQSSDNRINAAGLSHSETSGSNGYVRLTGAYRSLSRPSSPMNAKASPVCPCVLQKIRKSGRKYGTCFHVPLLLPTQGIERFALQIPREIFAYAKTPLGPATLIAGVALATP